MGWHKGLFATPGDAQATGGNADAAGFGDGPGSVDTMFRALMVACLFKALLVLSACTGTEDLFRSAADDAAAQGGTTTQNGPLTTPETLTVARLPDGVAARIRFAPIVGSTVEAVTPLSRRLSLRAGAAGIDLAGSEDATYTHLVKGYFSALPEGRVTTIIFVFDMLDPAGMRLHRIQGQEVTPADGTADEPWTGVPASVMERIADRVINEMTVWLAANA